MAVGSSRAYRVLNRRSLAVPWAIGTILIWERKGGRSVGFCRKESNHRDPEQDPESSTKTLGLARGSACGFGGGRRPSQTSRGDVLGFRSCPRAQAALGTDPGFLGKLEATVAGQSCIEALP